MPLFVKLEGRGEATVNLTGKYGFTRDGLWHKIEIPMSEFFNQGLVWDGLMANKNYFTLISETAEPNATIGFDYVYFYADKSSALSMVNQEKLQILQNATSIHIVNANNQVITIYSIQGKILYRGNSDIISTVNYPKGIYLAKVGPLTTKFILN
jgi:hypothetical protein